MYRSIAALLASLALAACDRPPEPPATPRVDSVTPPDADGIPTHVPQLAPQVRELQRANTVEQQTLDAAERQRAEIEAATQ